MLEAETKLKLNICYTLKSFSIKLDYVMSLKYMYILIQNLLHMMWNHWSYTFCYGRYVPKLCFSEYKYQAVLSRFFFCHLSIRLPFEALSQRWLLTGRNTKRNPTVTFTPALGPPGFRKVRKSVGGFNHYSTEMTSIWGTSLCRWFGVVYGISLYTLLHSLPDRTL